MYVGYSESIQSPQYNPLDPDITLKESLSQLQSKEEKDSLKAISQDYELIICIFPYNTVRGAVAAFRFCCTTSNM